MDLRSDQIGLHVLKEIILENENRRREWTEKNDSTQISQLHKKKKKTSEEDSTFNRKVMMDSLWIIGAWGKN